MRTYLTDFLTRGGYNPEDRGLLLSAYDRIEASPAAYEKWSTALKIYGESEECDLGTVIRYADAISPAVGIHPYTAELLLLMCMTRRLRERYIERGIDLGIYENTVRDLRYKLEECKLVYGVVGTFVVYWFIGLFRLERFALGRLQFEVVDFGANYSKNGITLTPESRVINVHVPRSGEPLTEEACREAYLLAKAHFASAVVDPTPFVCDSWLLFPLHEHFLPRHTNTYKFFKSFDIFDFSFDPSGKDLWRLFDTMERDPKRLPADTSMRRAYIEYLTRGGILGSGRGILFV